MSPLQIELARALACCTFVPGTGPKRFAKDMARRANYAPDELLTEKQAAYLEQCAWRFRRQMPAHLVPAQKPEGA